MSKNLPEVTVNRSLIRRAVVQQAASSPVSVVTAVVGVLGLVGSLVLGGGLLLPAAALILIPAGFIANLQFRSTQFSQQYLNDIAAALARRRQRRFGEIRADLYDLASKLPAGNESGDLAARALEQFGHLHDKSELFLNVLDRKLHPGELAHARYLAAADGFFAKVMEHLGTAADTLELALGIADSDARQFQLRKVSDLIEQNTEALAAFDQAAGALAAMQDLDAMRSVDIVAITEQMEVIARQAARLGAPSGSE